jgi:hypothetical protein
LARVADRQAALESSKARLSSARSSAAIFIWKAPAPWCRRDASTWIEEIVQTVDFRRAQSFGDAQHSRYAVFGSFRFLFLQGLGERPRPCKYL